MKCLVSIVVCSLCYSCFGQVHTYNFASTNQTPLFLDAKELHLGYHSVHSKNNYSYDLQGSFSVSNNLAVLTNYSVLNSRIEKLDIENYNLLSGKYVEVGFGYYKKVTNRLVFEVFGAYGHGSQQHVYGNAIVDFDNYILPSESGEKYGTSSLKTNYFMIQPNFGYTSRYFDIAFSFKVSELSYYDVQNDIQRSYKEHTKLENLKDARALIMNPAITIRGGIDLVKLQLQFGKLSQQYGDFIQQDANYFSLGVVVKPSFATLKIQDKVSEEEIRNE